MQSKETAAAITPIAAILLAAGESNRMGETNKLLLPVLGEPMVRRSSRAIASIAKRIVVVGHDAENVQTALIGLGLQTVVNPNYHQGMLTSLQSAIALLSNEFLGALICLGDQPFIKQAQVERASEYFLNSNFPERSLVIAEYNGERGHPVIIGRDFFAEILDRHEDPHRGAQFLFHKYPERIHKIPMSDGDLCIDIDTPEDYLRAKEL